MIDIEKLAIEYLACQKSKIDGGLPLFCGNKDILETFAKSYLNEWLKEQVVAGYMNAHGMVVGNEGKQWVVGFDKPLIALPSEVK